MPKNELTGVERQLVLDYLKNGTVDLTLTLEQPPSPSDSDARSSFPQVIRAEQVQVLEQGIILLKNPSEYVSSFDGKSVKVQFYFNKLALHFVTKVQRSSAGLVLVVPQTISKSEDSTSRKHGGISVTVFYKVESNKGQEINITCDSDERFPLFARSDYKQRIETYFSEPASQQNESIANRIHAPLVIYADSERIVFAAKKTDMPLSLGAEYAVLVRFPIAGPIKERKVYLTCLVENIFENYECDRLCACAVFSSVREEDRRFLEDKTVD